MSMAHFQDSDSNDRRAIADRDNLCTRAYLLSLAGLAASGRTGLAAIPSPGAATDHVIGLLDVHLVPHAGRSSFPLSLVLF